METYKALDKKLQFLQLGSVDAQQYSHQNVKVDKTGYNFNNTDYVTSNSQLNQRVFKTNASVSNVFTNGQSIKFQVSEFTDEFIKDFQFRFTIKNNDAVNDLHVNNACSFIQTHNVFYKSEKIQKDVRQQENIFYNLFKINKDDQDLSAEIKGFKTDANDIIDLQDYITIPATESKTFLIDLYTIFNNVKLARQLLIGSLEVEIQFDNKIVLSSSSVANSDVELKNPELILNTVHVPQSVMQSHLQQVYKTGYSDYKIVVPQITSKKIDGNSITQDIEETITIDSYNKNTGFMLVFAKDNALTQNNFNDLHSMNYVNLTDTTGNTVFSFKGGITNLMNKQNILNHMPVEYIKKYNDQLYLINFGAANCLESLYQNQTQNHPFSFQGNEIMQISTSFKSAIANAVQICTMFFQYSFFRYNAVKDLITIPIEQIQQ